MSGVIPVALASLTSLATTCRRAPSSASTLRAPYILVTTCRSSPSPVSTPQTLEPEWCSLVVAFPVLVQGAVVVVALVFLVVVLVFLVIVVAPLAPLVPGVVRRL